MLKAALKPFVPRIVRRIPHIVAAKKRQLLNRMEVLSEPHFDEEGIAYFSKRILKCAGYLEYGSGGSTVAVARQRIPFTTVESDRRFLSAVRRRVGEVSDFAGARYIAVDIGITTEWGYPLFTDLTPRRIAKWKSYPLAPWPMRTLPDLILIDGRFRVACALVTIKNIYGKVDFEILFDDYSNRSYYHPVEKFARLHSMHGRMAVFKQKTIAMGELDAAIEQFSVDYR